MIQAMYRYKNTKISMDEAYVIHAPRYSSLVRVTSGQMDEDGTCESARIRKKPEVARSPGASTCREGQPEGAPA
jgi:hypothetical protein